MGRSGHQAWEATAAAVAHELATPLAAAQAAVRLIAGSDDPDMRRELGDAALRNLHLLDLQVRRLQHLGDAPPPQRQDDVDLLGLVRDVVDDLARSALADHPTSVEGDAVPQLRVDPDQIRQVLFNLLSNAAKFSPAGREIVVAVAAGDGSVRVQVRDRGSGVAPDDAERIFERYGRGDDRTPGAGLGLYLSRRIARAHLGDLRLVPAEKDDGAVFELTLPLETGNPERSVPGGNEERSDETGDPEGSVPGGNEERSDETGDPEGSVPGGNEERSDETGDPERI